MILSALLPALLAVGLLPSCIAQPSGLINSIDGETGISDVFKPISKRAKLTKLHKGKKVADRAEIAGLMATFRTVPYKASYFYIINEYGGDELIRQNACEHTVSGKGDYNMLFTICVDMSMFNRVAGEVTFDKMYLFKMNYRWIIENSSYQGEEILKPTLSSAINKSEDEKDFDIELQTEPDMMSKPIRISIDEKDCEYNSELGKKDCLWSPPDPSLRKIEPYSWLPDVW